MRLIDLTGQKFGRLTALYRLHNTKGKTKWLCICDCGNLAEVRLNSLQQGAIKSCGCYRKDLTIDRADVNGNYEPSNCRFISTKEQCNNKRSNVYLTFNGKTQTISQWSDELGIDYKSLQYRKSIDYFFVRDALDRSMSLRDVATKYHIPLDKIFDEYKSRRKMYNYCEIFNVMQEVYYNVR